MTHDGDAERPEFWEEAGRLMDEILADFAFTKPVRVSLRDVQVRIRLRLAQAAETRDAALRDAQGKIQLMSAGMHEANAEIERLRASFATLLHEYLDELHQRSDAAEPDGWRADRPGWYWARQYSFSEWRAYEWRIEDNRRYWTGLGLGNVPAKIGPALPPPPAASQEGER